MQPKTLSSPSSACPGSPREPSPPPQVVLDIDETMVCAYREANVPLELRGECTQGAAGAFQLFGEVTYDIIDILMCRRTHWPPPVVAIVVTRTFAWYGCGKTL